MVDRTPAENGSEAWGRLVQGFDPASARATLNVMSKIWTPPKGKTDNLSFPIEEWEEMVRRQDQRTGRQALTDGTKKAIMMDMCPIELERRLVLNSDRHDAYECQKGNHGLHRAAESCVRFTGQRAGRIVR